jgi:hypothetical protein
MVRPCHHNVLSLLGTELQANVQATAKPNNREQQHAGAGDSVTGTAKSSDYTTERYDQQNLGRENRDWCHDATDALV